MPQCELYLGKKLVRHHQKVSREFRLGVPALQQFPGCALLAAWNITTTDTPGSAASQFQRVSDIFWACSQFLHRYSHLFDARGQENCVSYIVK